MDKLRIAIMGYRHGHIGDVINRAKDGFMGASLVAACDEDSAACAKLSADKVSDKIFSSYKKMLDEVECDVVAVGDYYAKRGSIAIEALKRGKHVLSDKPICTSLRELDEIERLAMGKALRIGCMFDIRDFANFIKLREVIRSGAIGEVQALSMGGQHPLLHGSRAAWYFEEGKHGGTINDIGVHACDFIPWMTGKEIACINFARCWNGGFGAVPHFKDCGQFALALENGAGVLGDFSYLSPDSFGYSMPLYWRITAWGRGGVAESCISSKCVKLWSNGKNEMEEIPVGEGRPGGYFSSFVQDIRGETVDLDTIQVIKASRLALQAQALADK